MSSDPIANFDPSSAIEMLEDLHATARLNAILKLGVLIREHSFTEEEVIQAYREAVITDVMEK